jgi:hypothetical protein
MSSWAVTSSSERVQDFEHNKQSKQDLMNNKDKCSYTVCQVVSDAYARV